MSPLHDSDRARGQRIKGARIDVGKTQKQLALELGVSEGQVARYERGLNSPRTSELPKLAKALKRSESYLLSGAIEEADLRDFRIYVDRLITETTIIRATDPENALNEFERTHHTLTLKDHSTQHMTTRVADTTTGKELAKRRVTLA